ncbi:hypothetical protein KF728_18710 [Candidatus Obscuribacterales bacterium]|nr:hypothetical protein [Candidatus Obscuribacterales bacterium]
MHELNVVLLMFACAGFIAGALLSKHIASRKPIPPLLGWLSIGYVICAFVFSAQISAFVINALGAVGLNGNAASYTAVTLLTLVAGSALGFANSNLGSNKAAQKPDHE